MKEFIAQYINFINENSKFILLSTILAILLFGGIYSYNPQIINVFVETIDYKKLFQITFITICLLCLLLIILNLFLNYLDNKNTNEQEFERIYKIERDFKKLMNLKINSTTKITEEEKKELLEKLVIQFENGITEDFTRKIEEKFKINNLQQYSHRAISRLHEEIYSLNRRGNINLFIGMFLSLSGLAYLGFTVYTSNAYTTYEMLFIHLAPRTLFVIFIELFSFFFLNLYKKSLDDIKYYQNEITNLEAKYLSLDQSKQSGNFKLLANALETLNKTERNFILKKDETTIELEKNKIEAQSSNNTIQALKDIINFKR